MKKLIGCLLFILLSNCKNYGELKLQYNLPKKLAEVSGIEKINNSNLLWMHNDSGNKAVIYGVDSKGKIIREIAINAKNNDWEDMTSDEKGNLYIADFGNNDNTRKNLKILKIKHQDLVEKEAVDVDKIKFSYASQTKFPPKKKHRFFDAESLLYNDGFLYFFTKSRVKNNYGKTTLYKIPAQKGTHIAQRISSFEACNDLSCSITASAIAPNGKKVALLNHQSVFIFSDFKKDDFFSGKIQEFPLGFVSQKESITFKDHNTLYIADEKAHGKGGKLYEFSLK
ncbi:hypothetical protein F7647_07355 [Tenacibaculum piscium]|uniref:hypothetical protein n=1 Tax=Tenacibaculum piscium TaxID=1458515 RepID=UPI00187BB418|nr:hypothetical protein [Tenacibaculum piscium]MBE7685878.1 hypothetical protein [Tenacibaculum piscium]MBE7690484.1 hypothetical protein [Tenacibaculum piscium]